VQWFGIRLARRRVPHGARPLAPRPLVRPDWVGGAPNDGGERVFPIRHFQALQAQSPTSSVDFSAFRRLRTRGLGAALKLFPAKLIVSAHTFSCEARRSTTRRVTSRLADDLWSCVPGVSVPTSVGEVGLGADQMWAPKFCAGSNSSPRRPVGNAAAPAWRARKRPEPGAARSVASSTTTRPRLNTVTGQPLTTRPS
jgi:hypothetical protein